MTSDSRCFCVADITFRLTVEGSRAGFDASGWKRWAPFASNGEAGIDLEIRLNEEEEVIPDLLVDSGPSETQGVKVGPGVHRFFRGGFDINLEEGSGKGPARCSGRVQRAFTSLDAALRMPVSFLLARRGKGFLMHASAVAKEKGAVVLTGHSGAGKSTAARNRPEGSSVLSDEVVGLFFRGDKIWAASTPFGGDLAPSGISALATSFFTIEHGEENAVLGIDGPDGLVRILDGVILATPDKEILESVLAVAARMAEILRPARLRCLADGSFWSLLDL